MTRQRTFEQRCLFLLVTKRRTGPTLLRRVLCRFLRRVPWHELHLLLRAESLRSLKLLEHALQVTNEPRMHSLGRGRWRHRVHFSPERLELRIRVSRLPADILSLRRNFHTHLLGILGRSKRVHQRPEARHLRTHLKDQACKCSTRLLKPIWTSSSSSSSIPPTSSTST